MMRHVLKLTVVLSRWWSWQAQAAPVGGGGGGGGDGVSAKQMEKELQNQASGRPGSTYHLPPTTLLVERPPLMGE